MLMPDPQTRPYGVASRGETPIYDQVRGERINADVPPCEADSPGAGYYGKHLLPPDTPIPAAVFGPPDPKDGLAPDHHRRAWAYPAGWAAADGHPTATVWGPRAALPPEAHPRHAASSSPASVADRDPVAQGAAAGDRGTHPAEPGQVR